VHVYSLAHLALPQGGRQDAFHEPEYITTHTSIPSNQCSTEVGRPPAL
jgi:hypothetical protein